MSSVKLDDDAAKRHQELEDLVRGIWEDTVRHVKDVLDGSQHGYDNYLELADPSIEQIVAHITKIDDLMNKMLDGAVIGELPIAAAMQLIDCQQCVHLIRRVQFALKQDNQSEYDDVIQKLRMHARH